MVQAGSLWDVTSETWLWVAIGTAILHVVFVWFCWRTELHARLLTRTLGKRAFDVYALLFAVMAAARFAAVVVLAVSNRDSLDSAAGALRALAVIAAIPAIYAAYSAVRYFGLRRALGIDHFDPSYRNRPFVKQGIFRFTRNGMYAFGFLAAWLPGLWCASAAGLCVAAFNHIYMWGHYYATELPDIRRIYG
jgi:protein-S-isoprenylcysteine O-methyltransferase Ste14